MGWRILRNLSATVFACLTIWACESISRHPAKPITKLEARNLPPGVVAQRVAAQLADVLELTPYPRRGRPRFILDDLWFSTRPRPTHVTGVCQSDVVVFEFEAAGPGGDADTPTRVKGVTAFSEFLLPPHAAKTQGLCDRLDPQTPGFFQAESPEAALAGMRLLENLLSQINSDSFAADFYCADESSPRAACAAILADFKLVDLRKIGRCERVGDNGSCWSFDTGPILINAYVSNDGSGERIWKVAVAEIVYLVHERVD